MDGRKNTLDSIISRIDKTTGCWTYQTVDRHGYGRVQFGGKIYAAHRLIYEFLVGEIPAGLQLDHLCRNRACVNPKHLEPVTGKENMLRGISPAARNAVKTHCPKGHLLSGDNVRIRKQGRECKECRKSGKLAAYHRRKKTQALFI